MPFLLNCTGPLDNPSDSKASAFTVKSKATVSPVFAGPYYQFDTVAFAGGITSEPVERAGLVKEYAWDFGNDGDYDTILDRSDTLRIRLADTGDYSVAVRLRDALGNFSYAMTTITVIPKFKIEVVLPDIDLSIDTACAFYTQNQYTMRPILLLGRYFTYRNKTESMTLGSFVFELLKNLVGTVDYSVLTLPLRRSFNNGVYTIANDSITISAAFHYGPGASGHNENDTIREDLFNPQSYVKSFKVQLTSPYYSFEKGPLWDMSSDFSVDVSNPLKPKLSLNITLDDLKFSCYREVTSRYTMSSEMNDTGGVMSPRYEDFLFNYHGIGRIHPLRIGDILVLVQTDSLEIDMAGSRIETDSLPMTFSFVEEHDTLKATFDFNLAQTMLEQLIRFGNADGQRKVLGSYAAQSGLSVNDRTFTNIYFNGVYSTAMADTAFFFCDEERENAFGTLYFDTPDTGLSTFDSDRYGYRFVMQQSLVTLVK